MTYITPTGQVTDQHEIDNVMAVMESKHYASGVYSLEFEKRFAAMMGKRYCMLCNSGSSANLLALASLGLKKGARVATTALAFPTTIAPIVQLGLIPHFVDVDLYTMLPRQEDIDRVDADAVLITHTLGRVSNITTDKPLIYDACDAVGSEGAMNGYINTSSFYPAHHMSMGEGGAILTDDARIKKIIESTRDWGRDCWCSPGTDNTCNKRFSHNFDGLPAGYDHKYVYTRLGYNLKTTDLSAAIGLAQLDKLDGFKERRRDNYKTLWNELILLTIQVERFLRLPSLQGGCNPFAFPIIVLKEAPFTRSQFVQHLESKGIGTRPIMGGNITRQPGFKGIGYYRSDLSNTDYIMEQGLYIGCWPGITDEQLEYMVKTINEFVEGSM
jgi:CDP-6-deoxy-D-xylo-4-hexulose-3-dehydrase